MILETHNKKVNQSTLSTNFVNNEFYFLFILTTNKM